MKHDFSRYYGVKVEDYATVAQAECGVEAIDNGMRFANMNGLQTKSEVCCGLTFVSLLIGCIFICLISCCIRQQVPHLKKVAADCIGKGVFKLNDEASQKTGWSGGYIQDILDDEKANIDRSRRQVLPAPVPQPPVIHLVIPAPDQGSTGRNNVEAAAPGQEPASLPVANQGGEDSSDPEAGLAVVDPAPPAALPVPVPPPELAVFDPAPPAASPLPVAPPAVAQLLAVEAADQAPPDEGSGKEAAVLVADSEESDKEASERHQTAKATLHAVEIGLSRMQKANGIDTSDSQDGSDSNGTDGGSYNDRGGSEDLYFNTSDEVDEEQEEDEKKKDDDSRPTKRQRTDSDDWSSGTFGTSSGEIEDVLLDKKATGHNASNAQKAIDGLMEACGEDEYGLSTSAELFDAVAASGEKAYKNGHGAKYKEHVTTVLASVCNFLESKYPAKSSK